MVQAIIDISERANRVLSVIKAKYGLQNKSEAINKFVEIYADEYLDLNADEAFVKEVINSCNQHGKKHPKRRMTSQQLDVL
ncbi:MAG: DUF2683 family protein [Candidatus Diapherotrites archaeon]|nr:DUF2683 family protein [Candidatus Diapherotrites archaeon]